ncbi:MAG: hypothetical protein J6B04_03385 [Clostridia bacterium]|nr:hypothetical protein [Clostridia bacterium]
MKKGLSLVMGSALLAVSCFSACGVAHTHTYDDSKWASNETIHWHASNCNPEECTEKNLKKDAAAHVDEGLDGVCDVCLYVIGEAHVHTYGETLFIGENGHYQKANCGHDVNSAEVAHEYDELGVCVCGDVVAAEISTVEKAVEIAVAQKPVEGNGVISFPGDYFGKTVEYAYDADILHLVEKSDDVVFNYYYSLDANGELVGIEVDSEGAVSNIAKNEDLPADYAKGYAFIAPIGQGNGNAYGAEGLIQALYEVAALNYNADLVETVGDNYEYSFSFGTADGESFYVVNVNFALNAKTYALKSAQVSIDDYYISLRDYETWELYPNLTETTDEDGNVIYAVNENSEKYTTTNIAIDQNMGEVVNPYPVEEVMVKSFKLTNENGEEIGNELTVEKSSYEYPSFYNVYLSDVAPSTAILTLADIKVVGTSVDEWKVFYEVINDATGTYVQIKGYSVGDHQIVISVNGVETPVTLKVIEPVPTELTVKEYYAADTAWWGGTIYEAANAQSTYTYWVGGEGALLGAAIDKGSNVIPISGDCYTPVDIEADYESVTAYQIDTTTAGEYTITFTVADTNLTASVNVIIKAKPDMTAALEGTYRYIRDGVNEWTVSFNSFSPIITVRNNYVEEGVLKGLTAKYDWTWDAENEEFNTTFKEGYNFGNIVSVNEDFKLVASGHVLEKVTADNALVGTWEYRETDYSTWEQYTAATMVYNADGTGVFEDENATVYFTYSVSYDEENYQYVVAYAADESKTSEGTSTRFTIGTASSTLNYASWSDTWSFSLYNGEMDSDGYTVTYYFNQPEAEVVYESVALSVGSKLNVYTSMFSNDASEKHLLIDAKEAGTYTVYATPWEGTELVASYDEYYFIVNGVKVVGQLQFVVEEAQLIDLEVVFVNEGFDYDFYVDFVAAPKEEDPDQGGEQTTGAKFIVTTDLQQSTNEGEYTYTVAEDGTITILKDGIVYTGITVTYAEGVLKYNGSPMTKTDDSEGLVGTWKLDTEFMGTMYEITFEEAQQSGGEESGIGGTYLGTDNFGNQFLTLVVDATTVTFTYAGYGNPSTVTYNYVISENVVSLTDDAGAEVLALQAAIVLGDDGVPSTATWNGTDYTLVKQASEGGEGGEGGEDDDDLNAEVTLEYSEIDEAYLATANISLEANKVYTITLVLTSGEPTIIRANLGMGNMVMWNADGNWAAQVTCFQSISSVTFMGDAEATFTVSVVEVVQGGDVEEEPAGTFDNPITVENGGEYAASVSGGWGDDSASVFYVYEATEDVTVTITFTNPSTQCITWSFDNFTEYEYSYEATITIEVAAGDTLKFKVEDGEYYTMTYNFTFTAGAESTEPEGGVESVTAYVSTATYAEEAVWETLV